MRGQTIDNKSCNYQKKNTDDYNTAQECGKLLKLILIDRKVKIFDLLVSVILI